MPATAIDLPGDRPRLHALTSLRFVTALHVFFFHLEAARVVFAPAPARLLASVGYVGVNWFFVLSGFILTYSYAGRMPELREFWRARLARVYPAYLVSLCLAAPFFIYICFYAPAGSDEGAIAAMRDHIFAVTLLAVGLAQAWVPAAALAINPVGWSLSAEAFFYFVFPLLLARLAGLSGRTLVVVLLGSGLASMAMAIGYVTWAPDGVRDVTYAANDLTWLNVLRFDPLVRLPEFMIGACGALLYLRKALSTRWAGVLAAGGMIALLAVTAYSRTIPYPLIHNGLLSLPFLAILYGVALRPWWSGFLEWRPFRLLGEVSYSFFLTHLLVIAIFFRPDGVPQQRSVGEVLACLAVAVLLSVVLYRGVEEPMRRRFSKARPAAPLTAGVTNDN